MHNRLSGQSSHGLMCFGDWSWKDLISLSDVVDSIKTQKRHLSDTSQEV